MNVYIVIAEHPTCPGQSTEVFSSMDAAMVRAVEHAELFAETLPAEVRATLPPTNFTNWQIVLELLEEHHGAQYVCIDILMREVQS